MGQLQLTCFGDFQVTREGAALTTFQADKIRALFVYLVLEGRSHQRADLAQFLWPGYSDESARNSLRQALHQLRQRLHQAEATPGGAPWLLLTRQTVQFNPGASIMVDVATFSDLIAQCGAHAHEQLTRCQPCLARLRQAVDLYHGDFLAGFTLADSDPFEEWRRITQEQLHIQMLAALTQLANAAESAGDTEGALRAAQRQLILEPWLEAAHRQIMRILAQQGQRAAAVAQFQRCRQVLAEELGIAPDAETTALYEQIQRGAFAQTTRQRDNKTGDRGYADKSVFRARPIPQKWDAPGDRMGLRQAQPAVTEFVEVSPSPPHLVTLPPAFPSFPTPLVGRSQALAEIDAHLQRPGARLLTLVGPGGMGKTRLAVEVGRARMTTFADGVFFVPLAHISTSVALSAAIATAFGITLQSGDPRSALFQTVRQKHLLLILDNFEQLLTEGAAAIDLVVDLLDAAPLIQIIVTSRERLKLRSEQLYAVQALTFATTATLAEAAASAAVRLFVQAVQQQQPDFQLTAANLAPVLRICRLVQGMPLGLELAAANAGGTPLRAIADAIEQSAEFLAVAWRDLPERQRSMRAVFAWSWQLLRADEQRILRQSAVFHGGFTYSAAQAVTDATLPLLTRLTDKSLLQWQTNATGEGRYLLHELLRQFAAEALQQMPDEATTVATRHSIYYLDFVTAQEHALTRNNARQAADEIQRELNNIQQAWQWAATHQGASDTQLIEALGRAAFGLWKFYSLRGPRSESEQMFQRALQPISTTGVERLSAQPDPPQHQATRSKLLALYASSLVVEGKLDDAAAVARQAITLGETHASAEGEVMGSVALAQAVAHKHRFAEARPLFDKALHLVYHYRQFDPSNEALIASELTIYEYLANVTYDIEGFQTSRAYIMKSLALCQRLGRELNEQECHYTLAILANLSGEYATAQQEYGAALALARRLGNQLGEMFALIGLGESERLQGNYASAQMAIDQGFTLARALNDRFGRITALVGLSQLHCLLGNLAGALTYVTELLQILADRDLLPENLVLILDAVAFYMHCSGQAQQALAYGEQGQQVRKEYVRIQLTLGHIRASIQDWAAASIAYQFAVTRYLQRGNRAMAAEPQAGLAQIALAQGDLAGALAQIEAILPILVEQPHAGFNDPFFIYLTCYRVLNATDDSRAATLLQQGYDLLQQDAAALDAESRQRFLTAVPLHCDLIATYTAYRTRRALPGEVTGA